MPNAMLYAKAGYTNAQAKIVVEQSDYKLRASDNLDGHRLGAGVEHQFGPFTVRAEYPFSDYGNTDVFGLNVSPERHQVVIGALAKF